MIRAGARLDEALEEITARLAAAGVPTPRIDATWLVRHVTRLSGAGLRLNGAVRLSDQAAESLEPLVRRREAREPLQLLVGTVGFRHLDLDVRPGVFVPRPETETLAGEAIDRTPAGGLALEPCTGSGAVACAVATEARAHVVATDVSPDAVALARRNVERVRADVEVRLGDLLAPVPAVLRRRVDVLVCNPPYVATDELDGLEPEVLGWDPPTALVAGPTGHEVSDRLIAEAPAWLRPGGWLLLEVDAARARPCAERCRAAGYVETRVVADLTGRDRVVCARI